MRIASIFMLLLSILPSAVFAETKPNVIFILADDWGIGDVKCFGGDLCRIETPHMDALAKRGMRFTDAHSSSSVCTPTRYSVLTGRYNWRSRLKRGVLYGYDEPLIEAERQTIAGFLQKQGYQTACIGKWHLGMNMPTRDGKRPFSKMTAKDHDKPLDPAKCNVDWKGAITGGPTSVGFDHFYGISASLDMPPYIWIQDDRFVGECTTAKAFHRSGPAHADFFDYDVLPTITEKSVEFVEQQAAANKPFFLYMPLNAPHTPISPSEGFQGKSGLGKYADFVMETDWAVGQVVSAVDKAGIAKSTLIIVTADNGCSPAAASRAGKNSLNLTFNEAITGEAVADHHYACSIYRGHKADIYEGGHRVPFIAKWDGKIQAGSVCDSPVCHVDLFATCAEVAETKPASDSAVDSISFLPQLLGEDASNARETVIHHSINGSFALRSGKWKLAFCPGSGGWSSPRPLKAKEAKEKKESGELESVQLFDLQADPSEQHNVASQHPELVEKMTEAILQQISRGRTTPGSNQENNGETRLYPDWLRHLK